MRQTVYKCDQCKSEFGEKTHISLSFGNFSGVAFKPKDDYWEVRKQLKGRFVHFCNPKCIAAFFRTLIKEAKDDISF